MDGMDEALLITARARVLADLRACCMDDASAVSILEDALAQRQWWVSQWPEGAAYVAGLVAQDVQDALFETRARWPRCHICDLDGPEHSLHIHPDLGGPDPMWVCEHAGATVSPLGELG